MQTKTLHALKNTTVDAPMTTLRVSEAVFGKGTPKKKINPTLYKLQKDGYVDKKCEANGSKPHWYLTTKGISEELINNSNSPETLK